jgi:asparagine synthase (glutamine-hydrolysing)
MCGIAGIINLHGNPVEPSRLEAMTRLVGHRGPDGEEFYYRRNVGLGHRLLSITGYERPAVQPFSDPSGQRVIVYNGEVFNFREIRKELQTKGYLFETDSDTEVILHAYAEYGNTMTSRFNGMWALAIIDFTRNTVFLSRDRFGQKSLYYTFHDNAFLFFSELKQLKAFPGFSWNLNVPKAIQFLTGNGINDDGQCLINGVFELNPGESGELNMQHGQLHTWQWYAIEAQSATMPVEMEEASFRFRELLYDSIQLRMTEHHPVGAFLSGGMDSSSLIALIHQNGLKEKLSGTVSCVIAHEQYNEESYMDLLAGHFGLQPSKIYPEMSELLTESIDENTWQQDQPFTSTCHIAENLLFEECHRMGLKIMVDGQGADEILGGYGLFYYTKFLRSFRLGQVRSQLTKIWQKAAGDQTSFLHEMREIMRFHPALVTLKPLHKKSREVAGWLRKGQWQPARQPDLTAGGSDGLVRQLSIDLLKNDLPYLLHSVDRNSMAFGVETRLPFLDHRLVEFALSLPDHLKVDGLTTKKILKESARDMLPTAILDRRKMGFSTPDDDILKKLPASAWNLDELFERFPGLFTEKLKQSVNGFTSGTMPFNFGLFRVLSFSRWARMFDVQFSMFGLIIGLAA